MVAEAAVAAGGGAGSGGGNGGTGGAGGTGGNGGGTGGGWIARGGGGIMAGGGLPVNQPLDGPKFPMRSGGPGPPGGTSGGGTSGSGTGTSGGSCGPAEWRQLLSAWGWRWAARWWWKPQPPAPDLPAPRQSARAW